MRRIFCGFVFRLRISPRIWSQNRNGSKGSVRDLWETNFCKKPENPPHCHVPLKGKCHEIFCFRFFSWITFPQAPDNYITVGSFRIFSKIRGDIRKSRCTTGVNDTGGKFTTGVNDTGGKLPPVSTTQTLSCEYLREFSKKFEMVLMEYTGPGGKLIHEKNQKQKISWHCPFTVGAESLCRCRWKVRYLRPLDL